MLAEDNELNMEIARYILEECGASVTPAWNGREAFELFRDKPSGSFDIILMDVMMPVMDGLEATRATRASGKSDAGTVPIVAMTANAYGEDRRAALEAGMNRHLAKPMERNELLRVLMIALCFIFLSGCGQDQGDKSDSAKRQPLTCI